MNPPGYKIARSYAAPFQKTLFQATDQLQLSGLLVVLNPLGEKIESGCAALFKVSRNLRAIGFRS